MAAAAVGPGAAAPPPLDQSVELRLFESTAEKQRLEAQAELFSICCAVEALEAAYVADSVQAEVYKPACQDLINKFEVQVGTLQAMGALPAGDVATAVRRFLAENAAGTGFQRADNRLLVAKMPHMTATATGGDAAAAFQAATAFITAMNAVDSWSHADELLPPIRDACEALAAVLSLPNDSFCKRKTQEWLATIRGMRAAERLPEDLRRQMAADLESAFAELQGAVRRLGGGEVQRRR